MHSFQGETELTFTFGINKAVMEEWALRNREEERLLVVERPAQDDPGGKTEGIE
jgi:hypothetical protein